MKIGQFKPHQTMIQNVTTVHFCKYSLRLHVITDTQVYTKD